MKHIPISVSPEVRNERSTRNIEAAFRLIQASISALVRDWGESSKAYSSGNFPASQVSVAYNRAPQCLTQYMFIQVSIATIPSTELL